MAGHEVSRLERELAERVGRSHCVATGSGTMALTMALEVLDLPPGSEVIVPSVCCPAVPFAVAYAGLVPVFCDISPADYVLDTAGVDAVLSERSRALVGVHLFGNPAPVDELAEYARSHSLVFVEDAAQAFGGSYRGEMLGRFGTMSITSFGPSKILSADGGGAVFTDDADLAAALREARRVHGDSRSPKARRNHTLYEYVDPTTDHPRFLPRAVQIRLASRLFKPLSFRSLQPREARARLRASASTRRQRGAAEPSRVAVSSVAHRSRAGPPRSARGRRLLPLHRAPRGRRSLAHSARAQPARYLGERALSRAARLVRVSRPLPVAESVAPRLLNLPVAPPCNADDVTRIATTLTELLSVAA